MEELIEMINDLGIRLESARNLVRNGRIVDAHNKMQGAITKCFILRETLLECARRQSEGEKNELAEPNKEKSV